MKVKSESEVAQSCPTLLDPMDCSPPASSVHWIFQARVLGWGAIAKTNIKELATCFLLEVLQFQILNSSLTPFLVDFHLRVQFSIFHLFKYYKISSYYLNEMDQNLTMYELRDDCSLE